MFDPFKKLKLASAFLGVDSPAATPENLDIAELFGRLSLKDLRGMTIQHEKLLEQPGVRALHETRYMPAAEPLDKLTDLGEGTLGFEYARYLRHYKLQQPRPPQNVDLTDAGTYLSQRVRVTHPILHVVTEYDASPLGELAVQAYYVGQLDNLISGVIISSVLLQITRDTPELLGPALEVTAEAYQRGKAARPFLGIAWEELWSAQVPQLRELIEVPARSSAVAQLRFGSATPSAPTRSASATTSPPASSSSSSFGEGFAAFSRSSQPSPAAKPSTSSPSSSPPSSSSSSTSRGFTGFGQSASSSAPAKPAPAPGRPTRPPEPPSKLLASFMALAEEAAQPAKPPEPAKPAPEPTPPPPPPRQEARPPSKPPPPPPPKAPAPEPTYQVEETAKHITPALSPDDPDYF